MAANQGDQPDISAEKIDNIVPDLPKLETEKDVKDDKNILERSASISSNDHVGEHRRSKRKCHKIATPTCQTLYFSSCFSRD